METAAFSTGVSIQWPLGSSASNQASAYREGASSYPFAFPDSSEISSARQYKADTQVYSACQELAYRFACEKTRSAVQAVLHNNNSSCYGQILRFFERYCERDAPLEREAIAVSPGRRDPNAPVLFPAFHGFPTAAVITGADATASDLWMDPLTLTLKRTFPLCLSLPRDVASARRFVEWLAARMAKLRYAKKREESWLNEQIEKFDLLPLDRPPVSAVAGGSVVRRVTRSHRTKVNKMKSAEQPDEEDYNSDGSLGAEWSGGDESSGSEGRSGNRRKRRRPTVAYRRWTMAKLLTGIQNDISEVLSPSSGEGSRQLVAMIGELVEEHLQRALAEVKRIQHNEQDALAQSIGCFDEAIEWIQHRISEYQEKAALTSSSAILNPVHGGSTEVQLALTLQSILRQYVTFLKVTKLKWDGIGGLQKAMAQKLTQLEYKYEFQSAATKKDDAGNVSTAPRAFLLLCIEQLETFSQPVLGDFLEIWTHFVRHQKENLHSSTPSCNLGFVVGVASAASPALRRLDLAVTSRLEVQFFSLVDSRNCFNDVLESLVVNANLPLALSGRVLRAISRRHQRLPSVPRLLLALRFLLFTHLRRNPWSFFALAVNSSPHSPILAAEKVARFPYHHRVSIWLRQWHRHLNSQTQDGRTTTTSDLSAWLVPFVDAQLVDLAAQVKTSNSVAGLEGDWIEMLDAALLTTRRQRARWRLGWHCFRAACTWLDIPLRGDGLDDGEDLSVIPLALALDGRLGEAACFSEVLQRLQHCTQWNLLSPLVQDWQSSFRRFAILEDDGENLDTKLSELVLLCEFAAAEKPPAKMLVALRQELADILTDHLLAALLYPRDPGTMSPADKLVLKWTVITDASVLDERLRFEYHDKLRNVLEEAGIGDRSDAVSDNSWVHDVGLAFLFYSESASASLSLSEWYDSFSTELMEEVKLAETKKTKTEVDIEIKARFVRAICTLRHWGFLKSDAPRDLEQDIVEKLVFI